MPIPSSSLDFNTRIWSHPLKKTLVKGCLNGKQVSYQNGWQINGVPVKNPKSVYKIKALFLQIGHWLKMAFSPPYRRKYQKAINTLNELQKKPSSIQKTKKQATIIQPPQQPVNHARLQEIDRELQEIGNRMDRETENFIKTKTALVNNLADYEVGKENIQTYLEYRKKPLSSITTLFNRQEAETINNCLKILNKLKHIEADWKTLKLQELERLLQWHKESIELTINELKNNEEAFKELEKELDEKMAQLNAEKNQLQLQPTPPLPTQQVVAPLALDQVDKTPDTGPFNIHAKAFFDYLKRNGSSEFAELWEKLLNNFALTQNGWDFITSFSRDKKNCQLKFKEPICIWISSLDENGQEDPPGGVIFVLGNNNQNKLTFTLTSQVMNISDGYQMLVKTPGWAATILRMLFITPPPFLTAQTTRIDFKNHKKVGITAKAYKKSKTREKSMTELWLNWGQKAEVIIQQPGVSLEEQNKTFLDKKASRS